MKKKLAVLDVNAPVVLGFTLICFISLVLGVVTGGKSTVLLFSVYQSPLSDPFFYVRLVGHIFGHSSWSHFIGNIMLILIIGPLLEEKYGSFDLALMILITALVTGIGNVIFFPNIRLLGASGVVFAMILASSLTCLKEKKIPLTFLLVAALYLGEEFYRAFFVQDNISQLTHIVGGVVGAGLGVIMGKGNRSNRT